MLQWWLRVDPTASWGKLFTVIESPAVSSGDFDTVNQGDSYSYVQGQVISRYFSTQLFKMRVMKPGSGIARPFLMVGLTIFTRSYLYM